MFNSTSSDAAPLPSLQPRVLLIVFNPIVQARRGKRLVETLHFTDPARLVKDYVRGLRSCSGGLANYEIVDRVESDEIPPKADGFRYRVDDYNHLYRAGRGFHSPDLVDYGLIIAEFDLLRRIAEEEIDEVWMFGAPYFGFWESTMGGAGAFFTNSEPLPNTASCPRRFVIMGFSYERGVGEMLENMH